MSHRRGTLEAMKVGRTLFGFCTPTLHILRSSDQLRFESSCSYPHSDMDSDHSTRRMMDGHDRSAPNLHGYPPLKYMIRDKGDPHAILNLAV